jgi:MFS family permease
MAPAKSSPADATITNSMPPSVGESGEPIAEKKLLNRGLITLLSIAFLGAANDNILKQLLIFMVVAGGVWANAIGPGTQSYIALVLAIPFILLSGFAGQIADKYSKRKVIKWVKTAEIPIALTATLGLLLGSFWISVFALLLFAIQSSFFGPAKFGVIPELVPAKKLSQANGLILALTNVGVILGSVAAGPLSDMYYPTIQSSSKSAISVTASADGETKTQEPSGGEPVFVPDPNKSPSRLPVGLTLIVVAALGFTATFWLPKLKPASPDRKLSFDVINSHRETFRTADKTLLVVLGSWSGFYLVASLALLLLPEFRSTLGVNNTKMSYIVGLLGVSIAVGSCFAGFLSRDKIRPYFSLGGAAGMTITFFLMGLLPISYLGLACLVFLIGFFAGFYLVPLQSLLQYLAPEGERGRFFGTANALSFTFVSLGAIIFLGFKSLGFTPANVALFCAGIALVGTIVGGIAMKRILRARDAHEELNSNG